MGEERGSTAAANTAPANTFPPRCAEKFHHPGIVTVIDHDVEAGVPWIAYEYLAGRCLRDMLRGGALPLRDALAIAIQVAAALEEVHAHGILHRDIKPENVLEAAPGRFKVTDFGIAKWCAKARSRTHTGHIPGTVYYVAPELIEGTPPSAQSDLYALGIMLYEMITGGVPFSGDGLVAVCKRHVEGAIPAASKQVPGVPPAVDRLLFTALAKEPRERFGSAAAMREAMERAAAALDANRGGAHRRPGAERATPVLGVAQAPRSHPALRAPGPLSRPVTARAWQGAIAALAGAVTAAALLVSGTCHGRVDRAVASTFQILEQGHGAALAGGAALSLLRAQAARPGMAAPVARERVPAPPVDERALRAALDAAGTELDLCRKATMDLVALLAPLATAGDQERAETRGQAHQQRIERLHARISSDTAALFAACDLEGDDAPRLALAARARALVFVTWTQIECARRVVQVAAWSRGHATFAVAGWGDRESPLGRAHYGAAGVPLAGAFLDAALAGLKRVAERGALAGPELADLLSDVQLVAWAAAQAEWEPRALDLLAPRIKAFKNGLNEITGREGQAVRWTAWCLWSWAEAGRAQANGRFYRKSALEGLERLAELVPPAGPGLWRLAERLRAVWKMR